MNIGQISGIALFSSMVSAQATSFRCIGNVLELGNYNQVAYLKCVCLIESSEWFNWNHSSVLLIVSFGCVQFRECTYRIWLQWTLHTQIDCMNRRIVTKWYKSSSLRCYTTQFFVRCVLSLPPRSQYHSSNWRKRRLEWRRRGSEKNT